MCPIARLTKARFSVMRLLVSLSFTALLGACSLSNTRDEGLVESHRELMRQQDEVLARHTTELESLRLSQEVLLTQVNTLQTLVASLNNNIVYLSSSLPSESDAEGAGAGTDQKMADNAAGNADQKVVLGRVEWVWLDASQSYQKARVDTGANSSSIHARNIQPFERNGDKWVKFVMEVDGKALEVEAPLVRKVRIRQASLDDWERRPVIKLNLRLGELEEETEFTLSDRSDMIYPVLLGRNFLQDIAVVDVAKKFTRSRKKEVSLQVNAQ